MAIGFALPPVLRADLALGETLLRLVDQPGDALKRNAEQPPS